MSHIDLPSGLPGILGLLVYRPETAKPLSELAEVLLRGENTLDRAERELIATHVSYGNGCHFCHSSHGAAATHHLGGDMTLVDSVRCDEPKGAPIPDKLLALLAIAGKVRRSGKDVTAEDVERARDQGASDIEIHDTILIAAAFCMFNRYVDGLATWAPDAQEDYTEAGARLAQDGYLLPLSR